MPGPGSSSVSRYRPAILISIGAAAAYAAWLIYSTAHVPQPEGHEGLRRSNAVRRPNQRARPRNTAPADVIHRLQEDGTSLGEFEFFGTEIRLNTRTLMPRENLRDIALHAEPTASPLLIEDRIRELYDTFLDRLLGVSCPNRPLSAAEASAIVQLVGARFPDQHDLARALDRHQRRHALADTEGVLTRDGAESIAATELSWRSDEDTEGGMDHEGQILQRTLYHIAEDRAKQEGVMHRGVTCNGCGNRPIRGTRWRCANCADFDLCSDCEATNSHFKTHVFYKIRIPAPYLNLAKQEVVYPGRPHAMSPSLKSSIKKRFVEDPSIRMETEEIEALWDQFTCLAATEWEADPNGIKWALDRRAFNHAMIPRYNSFASAPNLIYDRVFAYFDTDQNALVGFEEFIRGLDGLHSTDTKIKLRISFNAYDVDGDGYISRKDVLRIFRGHYAMEREASRNMLAEATEELSIRGALETIHSAQPLGSAFTQSSRSPDGRTNEQLRGKRIDDEDLEPIVDDRPDVMNREDVLRQTHQHDEAVQDRWARRHYYTDEEEGFTRPEGAEDGTSPDALGAHVGEEGSEPLTPEHERPRGSRSSSRVRFQDDVDIETRSNASTSSRPIGERWGGYEIPEPEKDLGKEVMYQITQQAFNELLDPLFKEKEDNAMDAFATRTERRKFAAEIERCMEESEEEKDFNKCVINLGEFHYASSIVDFYIKTDEYHLFQQDSPLIGEDLVAFTERSFLQAEKSVLVISKSWDNSWEPESIHMWNAKLYRSKLRQELSATFEVLAKRCDWLPSLSPLSTAYPEASEPLKTHEEEVIDRDPTMPQFRPNSLDELEASRTLSSSASSTNSEGAARTPSSSDLPLFVCPSIVSLEHSSTSEDSHGEARPGTPHPEGESLVDEDESRFANVELTTTIRPEWPTNHYTNYPTFYFLDVDPGTRKLHAIIQHVHPYLDLADDLFDRHVRHEAMNNSDSPLYIPFLASLEGVEQEINERKGSGLLNFEEFERIAVKGRLRYLEAWMDWVSF